MNMCVSECDYMLTHLDEFTAPKAIDLPPVHMPAWGSTLREPHGNVLIIAPWNYPLQLCLLPVIGAVAAGNTVVLKPSELAPNVSAWLATNMAKYLDNDLIAVIEGAVDETTELLRQRWDLIFYTGNPVVGKIVAAAAAKYLTPVVLELGGKSPVIVDESASLDVAAKRIAFGKFTNCGQTCIAPDYVFVHESVADAFVKRIKEVTQSFYTENPQDCKDYSRIIAERHVKRIDGLIKSVPKNTVVLGGQTDEKDRFVAPTIIYNPPRDSKVMQEEIFGPVLPIVTYTDLQQVLDEINLGEKPLALYLFTSNSATMNKVKYYTSSGSVSINETLLHGTCREIPFGGIGNSGYGNYYGRYSFNTFTHEKGIMQRTNIPDPSIKFPPFHPTGLKIVSALMKIQSLPKLSTVIGFALGVASLAFVGYSYHNGTLQSHIDNLPIKFQF